jgi:hypothetical protein
VRWAGWCLLLLAWPAPAWAGLHYSGEKQNELPAAWSGLLSDLRLLRSCATPPTAQQPASDLRQLYAEAAAELRAKAKRGPLSADEAADLGALLIRLGQVPEAVEVLRPAQAAHPNHFRLVANLGTAWQLLGDLDQAEAYLRMAVVHAPPEWRAAEALHWRLVRGRRAGNQDLDDLFDIRWQGQPKVPPGALALVQQLALWLPADGKLIWQLGEIAAALGDLRAGRDLLELAVGEFGLSQPALRARRLELRGLVKEQDRQALLNLSAQQEQHSGHASPINFKSRRALRVQRLDTRDLPPVSKTEVNPAPWGLFLETSVDRRFRPTFPKHLRELEGCKVTLTGFMHPVSDDLEAAEFLLVEMPVGCWYCEMPDLTGIVLVEMQPGKTVPLTRGALEVTGKLKLNATDPENFFFIVVDAVAGELK